MPDFFDAIANLSALEAATEQQMRGTGRLAQVFSCSQCPHHEHRSAHSEKGHYCTHSYPQELEYRNTYTNPPVWCPLPVSQPPAQPSASLASSSWESLANSAAGRAAVVIGKGPSLDAWLAAGSPQPDDAVLIGVNHATVIVPCHYGVTTHPECSAYAAIDTQWIVSLPIHPHSMDFSQWQKPAWAAHWFRHTTGFALLQQTRAQIADLHSLWNQSSSAHPAIHLAWYLGCASLLCIGLDGGHGYAQAVHSTTSPPVNPHGYIGCRKDTDGGAATLFGARWSHWGPA